ncbi:carbohydrate-binding module family 5 protein [Peniophora sp. CONT]|nr:carbohydrate-binding module family 5 protein [Peniophora sp. CONT]
MVSFLAQAYAALIAAACFVGSARAAPTGADLVERKTNAVAAVQDAPHFVVYTDAWISGETGPPDVSQLKGFNTYIMGFWLTTGVADQALEWTLITADQRAATKAAYAAAGIKMLVSAFGSTDYPTTNGANAVSTANSIAAWVKQYNLDGVDVDYEDFSAFNGGTTAAVDWLIAFTTQLRSQLPAGQYIITHAPVAPWFEKGYSGGGYLAVHNAVGSSIDWYNIQFYNQGQSQYTDCTGLLTASGGQYPGSSLFEISANGVDQNKLVIGKPALTGDAPSGGYISASTLATCVATAHAKGWNGGVMVWEFPDATAAWIQTVRGSTWPLSGGSTPTTTATPTTTTKAATTTTTTAPATTTTASSGGGTTCSGIAAWVNNVAYVAGNQVTYGGSLWTANWWTYGDTPGGAAGSWTKVKTC